MFHQLLWSPKQTSINWCEPPAQGRWHHFDEQGQQGSVSADKPLDQASINARHLHSSAIQSMTLITHVNPQQCHNSIHIQKLGVGDIGQESASFWAWHRPRIHHSGNPNCSNSKVSKRYLQNHWPKYQGHSNGLRPRCLARPRHLEKTKSKTKQQDQDYLARPSYLAQPR